MGEHLPCKQGVKSSNLSVSTQAEMPGILHLENFIQKENWLKETHGFRGFRGRGWK